MGRNAGFIALNSAIASGAESVLIPEEITSVELLAKDLIEQNKGRRSSIIIVAEGDDVGGAEKIMNQVKPLMTDYSLRSSILGHIQRGGRPSAFDRMLATRMGAYSVQLLLNGESNQMVASDGDEIIHLPISEAAKLIATPDLTKLEMLSKLRTLHH